MDTDWTELTVIHWPFMSWGGLVLWWGRRRTVWKHAAPWSAISQRLLHPVAFPNGRAALEQRWSTDTLPDDPEKPAQFGEPNAITSGVIDDRSYWWGYISINKVVYFRNLLLKEVNFLCLFHIIPLLVCVFDSLWQFLCEGYEVSVCLTNFTVAGTWAFVYDLKQYKILLVTLKQLVESHDVWESILEEIKVTPFVHNFRHTADIICIMLVHLSASAATFACTIGNSFKHNCWIFG